MLIPALNGGAADAVCECEFALADPSIVGFKHLKAIRLSGPQTRAGPGELMPKVAVATQAVVLGYAQVQNHDLIALAGVLERPAMSGLDADRFARAVHARRAGGGPGPDMNPQLAIHALNRQPR